MAGIFNRFGKHLRHLPEDLAQYDDEFLRYCVERELVETRLESTLHQTDDPEEIMNTTLKAVCDFYGGDWAGIMDIDMDTRIWRPIRWTYAEGTVDRMKERLNGLEDKTTGQEQVCSGLFLPGHTGRISSKGIEHTRRIRSVIR